MESTHPFSVSFAPCFQAVLCRSQLFFRMFLDKLFQICADRFIMKQKRRCFSPFLLSPSSRRAWIEMAGEWQALPCPCVALLAEGVDRNPHPPKPTAENSIVALLAEGVDRNSCPAIRLQRWKTSPSSRRAWIEIRLPPSTPITSSSPSSRRAWIEIDVYEWDCMWYNCRPPRGGRG